MVLRTLSICSGVGGLDLGIRRALRSRTVCYIERESYCQAALVVRMEEEALDLAPIWDDLKTFDGGPWRGKVDLVSGGYPCQPFSVAGSRRGSEDPRHLWPDVLRIVGEIAPELCFFENVPGHLSLGFEEVVADLEGLDYRVAAGLFTAQEVGASHKRERLFFLAHRDNARWGVSEKPRRNEQDPAESRHAGQDLAHRYSGRFNRLDPLLCIGGSQQDCAEVTGGGIELVDPSGGGTRAAKQSGCEYVTVAPGQGMVWPPGPDGDWSRIPEEAQPAIRGVADGAALRVDRLRALGNSVVPAQAELAFRTLARALNE